MFGWRGLVVGDIGFEANGSATLDASSEKESDRIWTIEVDLNCCQRDTPRHAVSHSPVECIYTPEHSPPKLQLALQHVYRL
jgi:hypothetical protein